jgi:RND superfamily putative drug exporter
MDVGAAGVSSLPDRFVSKQGFLALERDFPGATTNPVEVVVSDASGEGVERALSELRDRLAADRRFGEGEFTRSADGEVALLTVPMRGDPSGTEAVDTVRKLRAKTVPNTFAGTAAEALVGGQTSEDIDYFDSVIDPAPWVIGLVLLLTFLFLMVVFRSVVVAATAVGLNLLSVGAAYGLLVLVFQDGWGTDLFGFQQTRPGCRSSSSPSSTRSRWITRCSCSRASASPMTQQRTQRAPSPLASARRRGSSQAPRSSSWRSSPGSPAGI